MAVLILNVSVCSHLYRPRINSGENQGRTAPTCPQMAALSSMGGSEATRKSQDRIERLLDDFCAQDPECTPPPAWASQSEGLVCATGFYERLAYWLLHTYVKPAGAKGAGDPLDGDTPKVYLNLAINLAAKMYKNAGCADSKKFFLCLDLSSKSDEGIWLRGLRTNLTRNIFSRARENGQEMDKSEGAQTLPFAPTSRETSSKRVALQHRCLLKLTCLRALAVPLYLLAHIAPMLVGLARKGDTQATTRRHAAPLNPGRASLP